MTTQERIHHQKSIDLIKSTDLSDSDRVRLILFAASLGASLTQILGNNADQAGTLRTAAGVCRHFADYLEADINETTRV